MTYRTGSVLLAAGLLLGGCGGSEPEQTQTEAAAEAPAESTEITVSEAEIATNPLLQTWDTPYGVPPFDIIRDEHYMPAVKKGILDLRAEITEIVKNPEPATFSNTIIALEKAGATLSRVLDVFGNVTATDTNQTLSGLRAEIFPMVTREYNAILLDEYVYARVREVYDMRDQLGLNEVDARLLELTHRQFVRAGAALSPEVRAQVADINAELSSRSNAFGQNLLDATKAFKMKITDEAELAGLSDGFKASLYNDEEKAWFVGLNRSQFETFMTESENRERRRELFDAYRTRAAGGERDNYALAKEIALLRARRAALLGYDSHAHYQLETRMAKTPAGAEDFLRRVWEPGLETAKRERDAMQAMVGDEFEIAGEDWWHYAEKVRKARYDLDENALKPYFALEAVRNGAFTMANRLFGLSFEPVDVPVWNPTVTAYEVSDDDGSYLGIMFLDMYARDSKRGGAWMSSYRDASNIGGEEIRPLITFNLNLTTPPSGEPTLLRFSEVETFFHEFGHALHGIMTNIPYATFSGVDGPRDYTEFPAQILEHWASQPEMLDLFARHYDTGEPIPDELVERMLAAAKFNQGFSTTEYIAASLLDLRWYMLSEDEVAAIDDPRAFEVDVLNEYGLIDEIEPRYRTGYFNHVFASGYSAGYYAYLWSEILDADGFDAFLEAEDIFDTETAARLKKWIYQSGGLREADELYRLFRGQDPNIEPLLRGRGFLDGETT